MTQEPTRITDIESLKAFSHPMRIDLYRALHAAGPATASQLARQVDDAVSLVSYHLRKLADHGFLEEAPGQGTDGRERWWQLSAQSGVSFHAADFTGTPEGAAAYHRTIRQLLRSRLERYETFLNQHAAWPHEWTEASFSGDFQARLTAAELAELNEELGAVLQRWTDRGRAADAAGDTEGRELVEAQFYSFPVRP